MISRRYALKKDDNQQELVDAFERMGVSVFVLHAPADMLCGYRGKTHIVEVKNPARPKRYTPDQLKFQQLWRGDYSTVVSTDDVIEVVKSWQL